MKEESDLKLNRKECPKCGAIWLNNRHYWNTGVSGDERTLSNLVCSKLGDSTCINPQRSGEHYVGHDTWDARAKFISDWNPNNAND
jgi:hypothetical protein